LLAVDPNSPLPDIRLMEADLAGQVRPWRLGASLFGLFGLLALLVTVVGLYSVIAYVVEQRTREYGVRIALGASPGAVFGQTLRRGLAPAALGLPVGIVIALLVGRFLGPLLFETSPRDLGVFALVALTLLAVSVLASLVPAIRATRVDPVVALQAE
jgi:ABC-type antimicrobial peptide transport system permease subunit